MCNTENPSFILGTHGARGDQTLKAVLWLPLCLYVHKHVCMYVHIHTPWWDGLYVKTKTKKSLEPVKWLSRKGMCQKSLIFDELNLILGTVTEWEAHLKLASDFSAYTYTHITHTHSKDEIIMPRPGHTVMPVNPQEKRHSHAENTKLFSACSAPSKLDRLTIPIIKWLI